MAISRSRYSHVIEPDATRHSWLGHLYSQPIKPQQTFMQIIRVDCIIVKPVVEILIEAFQ